MRQLLPVYVPTVILALVSGAAVGGLMRVSQVQFDLGGFLGTIIAGLGAAWLGYRFVLRQYLSARRREEWVQRYVDRGLDVLAEAIADDIQTVYRSLSVVVHLIEAVRNDMPDDHVDRLMSQIQLRPMRFSVQYYRVMELFGDDGAPLSVALLAIATSISRAQDEIALVVPAYLLRARREIADKTERRDKIDQIEQKMVGRRNALLRIAAVAPVMLGVLVRATARYGTTANTQFNPERILEDAEVKEAFDGVLIRLQALVDEDPLDGDDADDDNDVGETSKKSK